METTKIGPSHPQLAQRGLQHFDEGLSSTSAIPELDVVRALHQTVVSLRTALSTSREELRRLKQQQQLSADFTNDIYGDAIKRLALENHVLRTRLLERAGEFSSDVASGSSSFPQLLAMADSQLPNKPLIIDVDTSRPKPSEAEDQIPATSKELVLGSDKLESPSEVTLIAESPRIPEVYPVEIRKLSSQGISNESENESEELDDIELIFTTEETCRDVGLQEDLVSITDTEHWQQQQHQQIPTLNDQRKSNLTICQSKSVECDVRFACNGSGSNGKGSSMDEAASSQSSSIDREESIDRFDESSSSRLNKIWSQCSVLVETDISKCGVLEDVDNVPRHNARRNTLAAPPTAYRPRFHRESLATGHRKSAVPLRPSTGYINLGLSYAGTRRESGAQTDISALPIQWRSESYLAHKVAHTFTTLPSKFAIPAGMPGRLRLSDKTREARRVMLSDISFTSMVPELSRSADHLCQDLQNQLQQHCHSSRGVNVISGCGLRTPEIYKREAWVRGGLGLLSPCEYRLSSESYLARYRGSLSSISSPATIGEFGSSRRHSWRPNSTTSFDGCRTTGTIPAPGSSLNRDNEVQKERPTWSSVPSSPTHARSSSATLVARLTGNTSRRTRSKVTFQEFPIIQSSLPNLRSDLFAENSSDSTESLIDEAEDYLRRSIDSILTISTESEHNTSKHATRRRRMRRHSEPNVFRECTRVDVRPYLPKIPWDLKLGHLVKIISPDGKILQGRVRYIGPVVDCEDIHVGIELLKKIGSSDGVYHGKRYFDCGPEHAIFVPFKKVVLAWSIT